MDDDESKRDTIGKGSKVTTDTNESSSAEKSKASVPAAPSNVSAKSDDLPRGWIQRTSRSTGRSYYVYTDGRTKDSLSQFSRPPPSSSVSSHYDDVSTSDSSATRHTSPIATLRKFHNSVKGELADQATVLAKETFGADVKLRIVDLAGGKGSGFHKWHHAPISKYYLLDISVQCCLEAQRRMRSLKRKAPFTDCKTHIVCADVSHPLPLTFKPGAAAHIVTMHFALNYFATTPRTMQTLMQNIASILEPGGLLILTFANWDTIAGHFAAVAGTDKKGVLATSLFKLVQDPECAKRYSVTLPGCLSECSEYGVRPGIDVECRAAAAGMRLLRFVSALPLFDPDNRAKLSAEETLLSSLYCSMMFKKV